MKDLSKEKLEDFLYNGDLELDELIELKKNMNDDTRLKLTEVLIALGICSATNDMIKKALSNIPKLSGCDAHATYIVTNGDKTSLKKLNINLTCESNYKDILE